MHRKWFSTLAFGGFLILTVSVASAQTRSGTQSLAPARKDLTVLHYPDLSALESSVREQISQAQSELATVLKQANVSEKALSEAYGKMGQTYQAYSLNAPARECYRNANVLAPRDFRWMYLLGTLDRAEGRFDEAIDRYRLALTLRPRYAPALVNLGNLLLERNRLDEAVMVFKSALESEEPSPAAHYGLGQVAMSKRNYAEAVDEFEKTLAQLPGANRVHYSLAMAFRGLGNVEKMKAHLAQQGSVGVRVIDPLVDGLQELIVGERLFLARANQAIQAQRFAEAAVELRKAVSLKPDNVSTRINLGSVLTQLGDLEGAAKQFEEALRIEPDRVNAHYNLGVLLAQQRKHEEAISHLRAALRIAPNDMIARRLLASELARSGLDDDALAEFTRVLEANPDDEGAMLEQVKLLHKKGEYRQALVVLKAAHEQYPKRGHTVLLLAYLLITSPDYQLRDGTRGLELAQLLYQATGAVRQGSLVTLALAELGRCAEAGAWQRRMIVAAEGLGTGELAATLKRTLTLYDQVQSCRPTGDAKLSELSWYELTR